jgi:flap endonuclease-1
MGVHQLHNYLKTFKYSEMHPWSFFRNKTLAVDASIYIYQFKCEGHLCKQIQRMVDMLHLYNCRLIFVFDGKPPELKNDELLRRREEKSCAWIQAKTCTDPELSLKLKRDSMCISVDDIDRVKNVLDENNVPYQDAEGEADEHCAKLVRQNIAYACLSEDSDLLVYGCTIVLRLFQFHTPKIMVYNLPKILHQLRMSQEEFQQICILAGNDYNQDQISIVVLMKYFHQYKKSKEKHFLTWFSKQHTLPPHFNTIFGHIASA